jgi:hypothetical protein
VCHWIANQDALDEGTYRCRFAAKEYEGGVAVEIFVLRVAHERRRFRAVNAQLL